MPFIKILDSILIENNELNKLLTFFYKKPHLYNH